MVVQMDKMVTKFRVWEEISNTMLYDMDSILKNPSVIPSKLFSGEDETLKILWHFGKQDKNGKDIYQGDIIKLINELGNEIFVVCEFGNAEREIMGVKLSNCEITGLYFKLENGIKTFPILKNYKGVSDYDLFEVVGNVYENKELLK